MKKILCSNLKVKPACLACRAPIYTDHKWRKLTPPCWLKIYHDEINKFTANEDVKNYIIDRVTTKFGTAETARLLSITINKLFPQYIDLLNKILILT